MQIVRLVEDYTPDATAHVIPKQILHKKDLLLRVYPAEDGWVIVKPLQSTTSDPSWVPEKLIKPASPGLYRARSDIAHPLESRSISAGEIVKVIDTRPIYGIPNEWTNIFREGWWKLEQLDETAYIYYCAPSSLEAVDILENPPRDANATIDIVELPPRNPGATTSRVSSDSPGERSLPSPGLIKSLVNSVRRRRRTVIVSEGAPPPYVDDRKNYAARVWKDVMCDGKGLPRQ